ncbi:MAG: hypothetical protein IKB86_03915 [Clostridia bacterium]|nr:hypothetical protein [Clostridia bacterium]
MIEKLKYALYHSWSIILVLIFAVFVVSSTVHDVVSQLNSAKDGIEIILIDSVLSSESNPQMEKHVKNVTQVKHVGISALDYADATEFVQTIENYTFADYVQFLVQSKNTEIVFVNKNLLETVYSIKSAVPLEIEGTFEECCYKDGVLYALPVKNLPVTDTGATLISLQSDVYAVLTQGDHTPEAREFLKSLITEE